MGDSIGLTYDNRLPREVVQAAIDFWQDCSNYREDFPSLVNGGQGTRMIDVRYTKAGPGQRCGSFSGSTVKLYDTARNGESQVARCGLLAQNLAHEIGHLLGLADAPDSRACQTSIMSRVHSGRFDQRQVTEAECRAVGKRWLTSVETKLELKKMYLPAIGPHRPEVYLK
jgi:hypothetical protein